MNAARELLDDLAVIGATIEPAGDRLILRAGPIAIPAVLVNRVRGAKADLIATLACPAHQRQKPRRGSAASRIRSRTFETCLVDWLNRHPAPSVPGCCAWCGKLEAPGTVVLPFGSEPETHTWLHAECWPAWHQARRAQAIKALRGTGHISERSLHDR